MSGKNRLLYWTLNTGVYLQFFITCRVMGRWRIPVAMGTRGRVSPEQVADLYITGWRETTFSDFNTEMNPDENSQTRTFLLWGCSHNPNQLYQQKKICTGNLLCCLSWQFDRSENSGEKKTFCTVIVNVKSYYHASLQVDLELQNVSSVLFSFVLLLSTHQRSSSSVSLIYSHFLLMYSLFLISISMYIFFSRPIQFRPLLLHHLIPYYFFLILWVLIQLGYLLTL